MTSEHHSETRKRKPLQRADDDLEGRDPDYIREQLPLWWLLSYLWFRAEVRGMEKIPQKGPALLVGNHSGGNVTPDTRVFALAFSSYFGGERPFFQLAHSLVLELPGMGWPRKWGAIPASPENADRALARARRCSSTPEAIARWPVRAGNPRRSTSANARDSCTRHIGTMCRWFPSSPSGARRPRSS